MPRSSKTGYKQALSALVQEDGLSEGEVSAQFLDYVPSLVNTEDNYDLMKPFIRKEILDVIWAMESDKALGLDGFSFQFYKFFQNIIKPRSAW